jgi:hypothetical protein
MVGRLQTDGQFNPSSTAVLGLIHVCKVVFVYSEIGLRLAAVGTLKRYSKVLEYEYRVKTAALGTLKRYSILSLTLYLE